MSGIVPMESRSIIFEMRDFFTRDGMINLSNETRIRELEIHSARSSSLEYSILYFSIEGFACKMKIEFTEQDSQ